MTYYERRALRRSRSKIAESHMPINSAKLATTTKLRHKLWLKKYAPMACKTAQTTSAASIQPIILRDET